MRCSALERGDDDAAPLYVRDKVAMTVTERAQRKAGPPAATGA